MNRIDLAIIIPTLNEEGFIGNLLDSIAKQTVAPRDVIVVDAKSTDRTIQEVKKRKTLIPQLQIVSIEKYTIARQRNRGASKTNASNLLFLDADVVLKDPKTLERYTGEVERIKPDIASASNLPTEWYWKDIVYFFGMNVVFKLMRSLWPMTLGANMYVRADTFKKLLGFDEEVRIGEDIEFVQRAMKQKFRFVFLEEAIVYKSARRLKREGRRKFSRKMLKSFWHVKRKGFRNNPIEYEFGSYKSP